MPMTSPECTPTSKLPLHWWFSPCNYETIVQSLNSVGSTTYWERQLPGEVTWRCCCDLKIKWTSISAIIIQTLTVVSSAVFRKIAPFKFWPRPIGQPSADHYSNIFMGAKSPAGENFDRQSVWVNPDSTERVWKPPSTAKRYTTSEWTTIDSLSTHLSTFVTSQPLRSAILPTIDFAVSSF